MFEGRIFNRESAFQAVPIGISCAPLEYFVGGGGGIVFNATFNNISVISWRSVL
jgi:hypothetical protein